MKILFLLFALVCPLLAQKDWIAAGVGVNHNLTEWVAYATEISEPQQLFSYSTYETRLQPRKVPTVSSRTGLAWGLKDVKFGAWELRVFALGTAGVSQTSSAVTGSFAGGGAATLRHGHWTVHVGTHAATGAASGPVKELSVGYAW